MKIKFLLTACLLVFLAGCSAAPIKREEILLQAREIKAAAAPEVIEESVSRPAPSLDPEKLVYKAKFLGFTIGEFIMINHGKIRWNGREVYSFELIVKTAAFFAKLFNTKDRYMSYMDPKEFVVLRHEEYVEGGTRLESAVDFDHKNHIATFKNFIKPWEEKVAIPEKVLDVLSGSYYLRMIPWELGDTVELKIYADQKIYDYIGLLHSKAVVKLPPYGEQPAYILKPYAFHNGEQIKQVSAQVYFSTTTPRKALRAVMKSVLGGVSVILAEGFEQESQP